MSEETTKYEVQASPSALIQFALEKGADLEKLEKMLALQVKWEENEAKKLYHKAMAKFKKNPPEIDKDKSVSFGAGKTSYKHASLANVTKKIGSALSDCGLSASWQTSQSNGSVTVTCTITHEQGHSESTSLTASPDTSGSKNAIQAIGSTISYLERYTILALTGLATHDMDDDGAGTEVEYIDDKQVGQILDMINGKNIDMDEFVKFMEVESVEKIPAKSFGSAMKVLKKAKGRQRQPGEDDE